MKKLLPFLLISALFLFLTKPVLAQITSMTVIPPRLELTADPGKTITADLKLRNDTATTLYYTVYVNNFIVSDDKGTPIPIPDSIDNRWNMKSWIKAPTVIPVDARTVAPVHITINVPKNALPGGHYALVTYQPNPDATPTDLKKTGSLIGQRAGTILYLTVSGPINQNAALINFSAPLFSEQGPIPFTGIVKNNSDIHVNAQGTIAITDIFGRRIDQVPVQTGNIFPLAQRVFNASWNQKWGYGRYRADLSLAYGTAGGVVTSTIFFWLFPIRLVIYILIVIIAILFLIVIINKRSKERQVELETEVKELKKEIETLEKKT